MSRFRTFALPRTVGRGIRAVLLLACFGALVVAPAAGGETPPDTTPPVLVVPEGQTVRIGDVAPDDVIMYTWDALGPIGREQIGLSSPDDLRNLRVRGPWVIPEWSMPGPDADGVQNVSDESVPPDAISVTVTPEAGLGKILVPGRDDGALA